MSFQDKVVIVTGASSGIGAAAAKMFAKEKAKVVLVGRNIEKLSKVEADIKKTTGTNPLVVTAELSNEAAARGVIDKTIAHFKKLDVLVNNAGHGKTTAILDKDYIALFDGILATNLRAVAVLTHAAAPYLIKTKGNIINISSGASKISMKAFSAYATSKAGLDHLSRCLAVELAEHGVRVNVINPGPVLTDFAINAGLSQEESDKVFEVQKSASPLKRVSESDEIGELILFLASNKARSVTGSAYLMDCGVTLTFNNEVKIDI